MHATRCDPSEKVRCDLDKTTRGQKVDVYLHFLFLFFDRLWCQLKHKNQILRNLPSQNSFWESLYFKFL